jgi:hypothetical protein
MRNKRRDGKRVKWPDGYHNILPYIMPKRTEAEVSMTEQFDVTDLVKYMAERNEKEGTNLKIFHAICTAVARTVYHRPKLNYFISGRRYYERPDITLSFVVKQKFEDDADETPEKEPVEAPKTKAIEPRTPGRFKVAMRLISMGVRELFTGRITREAKKRGKRK